MGVVGFQPNLLQLLDHERSRIVHLWFSAANHADKYVRDNDINMFFLWTAWNYFTVKIFVIILHFLHENVIDVIVEISVEVNAPIKRLEVPRLLTWTDIAGAGVGESADAQDGSAKNVHEVRERTCNQAAASSLRLLLLTVDRMVAFCLLRPMRGTTKKGVIYFEEDDESDVAGRRWSEQGLSTKDEDADDQCLCDVCKKMRESRFETEKRKPLGCCNLCGAKSKVRTAVEPDIGSEADTDATGTPAAHVTTAADTTVVCSDDASSEVGACGTDSGTDVDADRSLQSPASTLQRRVALRVAQAAVRLRGANTISTKHVAHNTRVFFDTVFFQPALLFAYVVPTLATLYVSAFMRRPFPAFIPNCYTSTPCIGCDNVTCASLNSSSLCNSDTRCTWTAASDGYTATFWMWSFFVLAPQWTGAVCALRLATAVLSLTKHMDVDLHNRNTDTMKLLKHLTFYLTLAWAGGFMLMTFGLTLGANFAAGGKDEKLKDFLMWVSGITVLACTSILISCLTWEAWSKMKRLREHECELWARRVQEQYARIRAASLHDPDSSGGPVRAPGAHSGVSKSEGDELAGWSDRSDEAVHRATKRLQDCLIMKKEVDSMWAFPIGSAAIKPVFVSLLASMTPALIKLYAELKVTPE